LNRYRTHSCGELTKKNKGQDIILSGWINKKRDHGNLLFIDLRDNYGVTQCVIDKSNEHFKELEKIQLESVVKINGKVVERSKDTINSDLKTGNVEVVINSFQILGECKELITTSTLPDLRSRTKNCIVAKIDKPEDDLMFALILKNFSDRQITIDKKLIDFIIKRVDRSYGKIFEFIYKIDEISLKRKKSIDFKIIKEVLRA
jgi:lysyl-tRNA synthetase class II